MKSLLALVCCLAPLSVLGSEELHLKGAVESLVSRLQNNGSESGMAMVPTVSVDLWTLLRLAAQHQLQEQGEKLKQQRRAAIASGKTFPAANLELTPLGDKNYFFSKRQVLSWIEAVAFCRLYGMDLASIESREEDVLIANHLNEIGLKMTVTVWVSGNKIGRAAYMWLNGEQLIYENWNAGEPAHFSTEHCIGTHKGTWHDLPCINSYHFICEEP